MPRPRSSGIQQHLSGNPCCDAPFSYLIFWYFRWSGASH
jgi:hypothetical protein